MTKIKDRVNKKMILIPNTVDISSIKFKDDKFNSLIQGLQLYKRFPNYIEFESVTPFGSLSFFGSSSDDYRVNISVATAKIFDFISDVELTEYQLNRLQDFLSNWINENPFKYTIENKSIINPYKGNSIPQTLN